MTHLHRHSELEIAQRAIRLVFAISAFYLIVELIGGILTHSLALLSDAGHMLSDTGALGIALIACRLAYRRASVRRTYGYGRAEILAALVNGLLLWLIVGAIVVEAVRRLLNPPSVLSGPMLAVGAVGLLVNLLSAGILFRHREYNLNLRGAFLHVLADSLGSVGVVVAGLLMWRFHWYLADPVASLFIGVLILVSSWGLIRESAHILLEGTPRHLSIEAIRTDLAQLQGVRDCHDLHIWLIGSGEPILTAHLDAQPDTDRTRVLREATFLLAEKYGIAHVTIQVEKESLPESPHGYGPTDE